MRKNRNTGQEKAISVKNLTKHYTDFVLNNISFEVPYGSIVGFIGENGAGKSTTIKAILGLIPIDGGEAELLGCKISSLQADVRWKEQISVVFDECNYPVELKVADIPKIMRNIYQTWDDTVFANYMNQFELPANKKIKELSKGMKMKLAIAAALAHDSHLLILDEATSGLDPVVRSEILDIFQEFIVDEQHAVFLSSHITSDIEKIADYILLIHKGEILLMENKDNLIYRYGMVKCSRVQAEKIPRELIVGREDNAFECRILVKDREQLPVNGYSVSGEKNAAFAVDRVSIEDILVYLVKKQEGRS